MQAEKDLIVVADSVTSLSSAAVGCVAVTGSHGGRYAAAVAARHGLRGAIFSDAGRGLDNAGIAGLALLQDVGMPAAAVSHLSARIGDGADLWARGVISAVNPEATALGCAVGQTVAEAAQRMRVGPPHPAIQFDLAEARLLLRRCRDVPVWALDSNSLVGTEDSGAVVVTGSHGGLLGGRPASAIKAAVLAAVYNDAGIGIDRAGCSRLPALAERGIAAATVGAASARIGDARSTWESGILSVVNAPAAAAGAATGMTVQAFITTILSAGHVK